MGNTERLHDAAAGLDALPVAEVAALLRDAQIEAAKSLLNEETLRAICAGSEAMAATLRAGGVLWYVGSGASGMLAAMDAMELGSTFGVASERIRIVMAGGVPTSPVTSAASDDDTDEAEAKLSRVSSGDTVIAVAASGGTPFTVTAAEVSRSRGAAVIGVANNAGSPLLLASDHAVLLETPPELVSGSTRMGAGTAQKIALNMLSTLMGLRLGHIYDGMMVNMRPGNDKLKHRATRIVGEIGNVSESVAAAALEDAADDIKVAAVMVSRGLSVEAADALIKENNGQLRAVLP
ncbi:MAG: N-acetylmuramic acid 6-phosphate etherase [Alphaproteobacteria bacterium]|nr:N-acetylmuramic acid 6-phosphate etherase [Alphaproteobacteria bacterium]MDA8004027.1 N-acetylmuramic acid 6-phosphate etherase [Alphaproteobacteria bacterium]MDA8005772.1 N-acetylmuramic acid 6-phosphate etherase [Alphaproteobacteria bacterium]MDA8012413.1 N-acetylmuramic acid 6-phosphate etherase [Alphaproteobacteria bacterium]